MFVDSERINFQSAVHFAERKYVFDDTTPPWMRLLVELIQKATQQGKSIEYQPGIVERLMRMGGTDHNDPTLRSIGSNQ